MRASHADTARQSAQVRDRLVDTARILRLAVTMPTVSVIELRKCPTSLYLERYNDALNASDLSQSQHSKSPQMS